MIWINQNKNILITKNNQNNFYYFFKFEAHTYNLEHMEDYWDIPDTEKLFSFSLFISNYENLSYLIGLVYNYAIIKKHFSEYKLRLYIDFHSVFGSPETFNIFNMFLDIINDIDPEYENTLQMIVFYLNPFYNINNESIYDSITIDTEEVKKYYVNILYNNNDIYIKSPLLNMNIEYNSKTQSQMTSVEVEAENIIDLNTDTLEINYNKIDNVVHKTSFSLFACHISVNLRFLPMNENCEFHVRDLDSRLSLTDKNIINKFNNPKYKYVPFYVFQFYKFYFPYLKWRIDVNPYLAGCFGGNNRKPVMISKSLLESGNMKILKKELFFKYILFISFNAANLQVGFLNDEFILANIFDKIKGKYSENDVVEAYRKAFIELGYQDNIKKYNYRNPIRTLSGKIGEENVHIIENTIGHIMETFLIGPGDIETKIINLVILAERIVSESSTEESTAKYNFYKMFFDKVIKEKSIIYGVPTRFGPNKLILKYYGLNNWESKFTEYKKSLWIGLRGKASPNKPPDKWGGSLGISV